MVSVAVSWTLVAAACTSGSVEDADSDPEDVGEQPDADGSDAPGGDVVAGSVWRVADGDGGLSEVDSLEVVTVPAPPVEDLPEGILAVAEGIEVDLSDQPEAVFEIRLPLPERPNDDAMPVAVLRNEEGAYETLTGEWDVDSQQLIVRIQSPAPIVAGLVGGGRMAGSTSLVRPPPAISWRIVGAVLCPACALWAGFQDLDEWLLDRADAFIGWTADVLDEVADRITGRTDPPECKDDPPSWAQATAPPNWLHTCLQSRMQEKTGESYAELVFKSNRRYFFMSAERKTSLSSFAKVESQSEWAARLLARLSGLDPLRFVLLPPGGVLRMGFYRPDFDQELPFTSGPNWRTLGFTIAMRLIEEILPIGLKKPHELLPAAYSFGMCVTGLDVTGGDLDPDLPDLEELLICMLKLLKAGLDASDIVSDSGAGRQAVKVLTQHLGEIGKVLEKTPVGRIVKYAGYVRDAAQQIWDIGSDADPVTLTLQGRQHSLPSPRSTQIARPAESGDHGPDDGDTAPVREVSVAGDYDGDDDGLIEIDTIEKLNAIRWDSDGDGKVDRGPDADNYALAFPEALPRMGCPESCLGYELIADLDFDTNGDGKVTAGDGDVAWSRGRGWQPIPLLLTTLAGNHHAISNLSIMAGESGTTVRHGFIGELGGLGRLVDIELADVDVRLSVEADSYSGHVGALVGINQGVIVDSHVTGTVEFGGLGVTRGGDSIDVGGLVGLNVGSIVSSESSVRVEAGHSGHSTELCGDYCYPFQVNVGGLVGNNEGSVELSSSLGNVVLSGSDTGNAGGLVGSSLGTISASFATGTVVGEPHSDLGGLVGSNGPLGHILASSAAGDVTSSQGRGGAVGGLVGVNEGSIDSSYATGAISADSASVGGLVGMLYGRGLAGMAGAIESSYASGSVTGCSSILGGLVGWNYDLDPFTGLLTSNRILHSYSAARIDSRCDSNEFGGLVGKSSSDDVSTATCYRAQSDEDCFSLADSKSYWIRDASGIPGGSGGNWSGGLTRRELSEPTGPSGIYTNWSNATWDFGSADELPVLRFAAP